MGLICFAWHNESPAKPRRARNAAVVESSKEEKTASNKEEKTASNRVPYSGPPCSCVQFMLQDRAPAGPSNNDIWYCINYRDTTNPCSDPDPDCWQGIPNPPTPQQCPSYRCEPLIENQRDEKKRFPGHGENLTGDNALGIVAQRLESARLHGGSKIKLAGSPEYHKLDRYKVMIVPLDVPDRNGGPAKRLYFGVELDSAPDLTTVTNVEVKDHPGGGRVSANYKVNGEKRAAVVWLKR